MQTIHAKAAFSGVNASTLKGHLLLKETTQNNSCTVFYYRHTCVSS